MKKEKKIKVWYVDKVWFIFIMFGFELENVVKNGVKFVIFKIGGLILRGVLI